MNTYVAWVTAHPLFSAAVQFAILGTIGEIISHTLRHGRFTLPGRGWQIAGKIAAWAILGLFVKYGFAGIRGFTQALFDHHLLPAFVENGIGRAVALSVCLNMFTGPQVMFLHRLEDNLIMGRRDFAGMAGALHTLYWFWVPAHTITFLLPVPYQIGLAAAWSLVLGVIMGLTRAR